MLELRVILKVEDGSSRTFASPKSAFSGNSPHRHMGAMEPGSSAGECIGSGGRGRRGDEGEEVKGV